MPNPRIPVARDLCQAAGLGARVRHRQRSIRAVSRPANQSLRCDTFESLLDASPCCSPRQRQPACIRWRAAFTETSTPRQATTRSPQPYRRWPIPPCWLRLRPTGFAMSERSTKASRPCPTCRARAGLAGCQRCVAERVPAHCDAQLDRRRLLGRSHRPGPLPLLLGSDASAPPIFGFASFLAPATLSAGTISALVLSHRRGSGRDEQTGHPRKSVSDYALLRRAEPSSCQRRNCG